MTGRTAGTNTLNLCAGPGGCETGASLLRLLHGDHGFRRTGRMVRQRLEDMDITIDRYLVVISEVTMADDC